MRRRRRMMTDDLQKYVKEKEKSKQEWGSTVPFQMNGKILR